MYSNQTWTVSSFKVLAYTSMIPGDGGGGGVKM